MLLFTLTLLTSISVAFMEGAVKLPKVDTEPTTVKVSTGLAVPMPILPDCVIEKLPLVNNNPEALIVPLTSNLKFAVALPIPTESLPVDSLTTAPSSVQPPPDAGAGVEQVKVSPIVVTYLPS